MESRRPKIVHLTSVHAPTDTRILRKECSALADEGYDVVLIAPSARPVALGKVRHRSVPVPRNRFTRFTRTIGEVYRAAREERADVYHFHDPELILLGIALRLRGARVIFDVHEDLALDVRSKPWIPPALRKALSYAAGLTLRGVQRCFTAIVPATPSIARSFSHRRTVVVRNYPRIEELQSGQASTPFERRAMAAIYAGSITLLRGAEQMVLALASAEIPPQARLVLAGEFEDEALRRRVSALPGWSRVDARGVLTRPALARALAGARMGVMVLQPTAHFEHSLPTKLFEYMACGLPVIASKFLACSEIVERYGCGVLVDPRDPAEIAHAMRRLFTSPREASAMGARGRQAVDGRYEWKSEARNLIALYREIV